MNQELKVKVQMSGSLHDDVVDGIGIDVAQMTGEDLTRRSGAWEATRRGRGWTYTALVSEEAARYIASYLRSRSGLSLCYDEGRGEARRSEEAGIRTAKMIEAQIGA